MDPHLFPYPEDTWGDWLHTQGLHMGANLHDATGVYKSEATFGAMCQALGLNATATANIPFDIMSSECVLPPWSSSRRLHVDPSPHRHDDVLVSATAT